jgi:hypothetical protein
MELWNEFGPWGYAQPMEKYSGTPIEAHEAWQMFDRWKSRDQELVSFFGAVRRICTR